MRWNVCMGHWAHAALHNFQTPDALHCLVKGERTGKCKELISYQNLPPLPTAHHTHSTVCKKRTEDFSSKSSLFFRV